MPNWVRGSWIGRRKLDELYQNIKKGCVEISTHPFSYP